MKQESLAAYRLWDIFAYRAWKSPFSPTVLRL